MTTPLKLELTEPEALFLERQLDPDLEGTEVILAKLQRAREISATMPRTVAPGARVKVVGNIRPQYAAGLVGTALSFPSETRHRRVKVLIDKDQHGFDRMSRFIRSDGTISFPRNTLEVIE